MKILRLKVTLNDSRPPIWRRIEVPASATFADLHIAIRDAMGWGGYHLHEFTFEGKGTKMPELIGTPSEDHMLTVHDENQELVKDWLGVKRKQCTYTYDFGDSWDHTVILEATIDSEAGAVYPRCTGGKRACPPEDSGGIWSYMHNLDIIKDPKHEDYAETLEWMGGDWDSETFNPASVVFSGEADLRDGGMSLPITTEVEAMEKLDDPLDSIPFEAIEFLRGTKTTPELLSRIQFVLENTYAEGMDFNPEGFADTSPLWYAVVAEAHLDSSLIKPSVQLLTATTNDWDFMNEQAQHLICLLAEKYPDEVADQTMKAIDAAMELGVHSPYLYLFDIFQIVDAKKYEKWLLAFAGNPNNFWMAPFAYTLAAIQFTPAAAVLEGVIESLRSGKRPPTTVVYDEADDIEDALHILQGKKEPYRDITQPEYLGRQDWKAHYTQFEDRFADDTSAPQDETTHPSTAEKNGRNQPCPCGSTKADGSSKKYKHCCGK